MSTPPLRALVNLPRSIVRGDIVEVRATLGHANETGHRRGNAGELVPRSIVRRIEARLDGALVFAADLQPAISANPYIAFPLRALASGTLVVSWRGDDGLAHSETLPFVVA